jgi:predicted enzyme related to lactoylglutathione lyase
MYALSSGVMLGLWARHDVKPAAQADGGGAELCFPVADADAVRQTHGDWSGRGLKIVQAPVQMDFGWTFCAHDPDGHRLRVFAPAAATAA